jgi:hypothetical protein
MTFVMFVRYVRCRDERSVVPSQCADAELTVV